VDGEESADGPYELSQLPPIALSSLRPKGTGKDGAERGGLTGLIQVEDGSGVCGRSQDGGRREGTRISQGRRGNVGKGETVWRAEGPKEVGGWDTKQFGVGTGMRDGLIGEQGRSGKRKTR
jgi:hypothetical protein